VRITADTNVLVRALTGDDPAQAAAAQAALQSAEAVAVPVPALCELVWVLAQGYKVPRNEIAQAVRRLIGAAGVIVDRPAAEAGLAVLEAGGDFADGAIAYEGRWLGAQTFVSFDHRAVQIIAAQGHAARLP
jgi:predicted nucleic-acid-binding protein